MIICRGTIPGTSIKCRAELVETDGRQFFVVAGGAVYAIEIDPNRVVCRHCGYKTRLRYQDSKKVQ